jgi:hypothetical protein
MGEVGRVSASSAQLKRFGMGGFGRFWSKTAIFGCFWAHPGIVGRVSRDEVGVGGADWIETVTDGEDGGSSYIGARVDMTRMWGVESGWSRLDDVGGL